MQALFDISKHQDSKSDCVFIYGEWARVEKYRVTKTADIFSLECCNRVGYLLSVNAIVYKTEEECKQLKQYVSLIKHFD